MIISEKVFFLYKTLSFRPIIQGNSSNIHGIIHLFSVFSLMGTNGEVMLSPLPCHREIRILEYNESLSSLHN